MQYFYIGTIVSTFSLTAHNYIYKLNLKPNALVALSGCSVDAVSRVVADIAVATSPIRARERSGRTGVV